MANGRGDRSRIDKGRDPGRFIGLPVSVLDSAAYLALSASARSLLLEVALQFHGDDNGRMLLSRAYLKTRGWNSSDMIDKGKRELLEAEFIFETVKGHRPNKASWYAMTWRRLDKLPGFDHGVERAFEQGAYKRAAPLVEVTKFKGYDKSRDHGLLPIGGAVLNPRGGTGTPRIGPQRGTESPSPDPRCGPVRGANCQSPVPRYGHPLEEPSAGVAVDVRVALAHGDRHQTAALAS